AAGLAGVEDNEPAAAELGIRYAADQIKELLDYGVAGLHLYCLNRAGSAEAIFARLGLSG
ncbi:methylenetetrahydrofolate reductase, partial [Candidatus Sumerlaeota bacterium]|nr:methylenetetrahydrofolate reductase [Candidatus Sumerlaeota bacterium]